MRTISHAKSEPVLRRGAPGDEEALAEIAAAAFGRFVAVIGRPPAPLQEDHAAALARGGVIVAADDEAILGFVSFSALPGEVRVDTVAVRPERHGEGLGRRLLSAVEERARAAGASTLTLYTNAAMAPNLTLYPHLGFRESGRREEDGFARVYFEKRLPPAAATKESVEGLYGRRRGQSHRPTDALARYSLSDGPIDPASLFGAGRPVRLEIGFGTGEHLLHHARTTPEVGLIGVEPFETGVMRVAAAAEREGLENLRLHLGDAREVLERLPAGSLERIDLLYPDPWPKRRHQKRRFVSPRTLQRMARALSPGGTLRFASDIEDYVAWTRAHVSADGTFAVVSDSATPWPGWPGTRYEAKAQREGRASRYVTLAHR